MSINNKILFISDCITHPFDEGFKNIAINLIRRIAYTNKAKLITNGDMDIVDDSIYINLGKTFISKTMVNILMKQKSGIIFYIPYSSLTMASFIRARVLKTFCKAGKVVLIGLQARQHSIFNRILLKFIGPDGLVVQSEAMKKEMAGLSGWIEIFTPGIDLVRFSPIAVSEKKALKAKYEVPDNKFMVLHVGHLKWSRNLQTIAAVIEKLPCCLCVVASSTTQAERDKTVVASLKRSGAIIFDGTINRIEEIYQMADCYIFPVLERTGATEMPLSVLEAMATNLPVISTPHGALPEIFTENRAAGLYYAKNAEEFTEAFNHILKNSISRTRELVSSYSWDKRIDDLMRRIEKRLSEN